MSMTPLYDFLTATDDARRLYRDSPWYHYVVTLVWRAENSDDDSRAVVRAALMDAATQIAAFIQAEVDRRMRTLDPLIIVHPSTVGNSAPSAVAGIPQGASRPKDSV